MIGSLRDTRLGIVYLAARLWLGFMFLNAGWEKVSGGGWLGSKAGIDGFLGFAASKPETAGAHPAVGGWYAWLIQHLFLHVDGALSYLVPLGEIAVGAGLVLGVLTLGAAFFGALLNLQFMLAGSTSGGDNPLMFGLGLLLLVAGSAAYVYGGDRVLLPRLRTLVRGRRSVAAAREPALDLDATARGIRLGLAVVLGLVAWHFGFTGVQGIGALALGAVSLVTAALGASPMARAVRLAHQHS